MKAKTRLHNSAILLPVPHEDPTAGQAIILHAGIRAVGHSPALPQARRAAQICTSTASTSGHSVTVPGNKDRTQTSAFRSQNGQQQYWAKRFFRIPETSTPPMSYRAAHRHLARRQKTKAPRISAKGLYEEPMSFCLYQAFAPSACIRRLPDIRGRGACIRYELVTPTRLYARSIPLCSSLSKKQNYPEHHDILTSSSVLYFADLLSA